MTDNYDDIINLPHHVSERHPQMSMQSRAAQFAPFAALTGHGAAIRETARQTDSREPDCTHIDILDREMVLLQEQLSTHPQVDITCFVPDKRKSGGRFVTLSGMVKTIDEVEKSMTMTDGTIIPLSSITEIKSDLFDSILME